MNQFKIEVMKNKKIKFKINRSAIKAGVPKYMNVNHSGYTQWGRKITEIGKTEIGKKYIGMLSGLNEMLNLEGFTIERNGLEVDVKWKNGSGKINIANYPDIVKEQLIDFVNFYKENKN